MGLFPQKRLREEILYALITSVFPKRMSTEILSYSTLAFPCITLSSCNLAVSQLHLNYQLGDICSCFLSVPKPTGSLSYYQDSVDSYCLPCHVLCFLMAHAFLSSYVKILVYGYLYLNPRLTVLFPSLLKFSDL